LNTSSQLVRGATWMVALRWAIRGLALLRMVVLARILAPDDFGVFAIALVVLGFIEFLSEGGIEFALIREQQAQREHFDSAWTIQIILGLFTASVIFLSAPIVAQAFEEPRATLVIQLIALRPAFNAFNNIGVVYFLKDFDFGKEFKFNIARNLIDAIVTISLAIVLRNYIALVVGTVAGAALTTVFSYYLHPYRPRLSFRKIRDIWSFSGWLLVSYAADEIGDLIDRTVIGIIWASKVLGIYHMGMMLGGVILDSTVFPLWRGLFPVYSKLANDPARMAESFLSVFAWVVLICCVAAFGVAAVAGDLVFAVLGEKWAAAIPLVPWLTFAVAINGVGDTALLILTALGLTKLCAGQALIRVVLLAIALPLAGLEWGVEGVAMAFFGVTTIHLAIPFYLLSRNTPVRLNDLVLHSWRPVASGVVMFVVVAMVGNAVDGGHFVALAAEIGAGAATFIGCIFLFWVISGRPDGPEATALDIVISRLGPERAD
jgi:lipopolysaccharide exporter